MSITQEQRLAEMMKRELPMVEDFLQEGLRVELPDDEKIEYEKSETIISSEEEEAEPLEEMSRRLDCHVKESVQPIMDYKTDKKYSEHYDGTFSNLDQVKEADRVNNFTKDVVHKIL